MVRKINLACKEHHLRAMDKSAHSFFFLFTDLALQGQHWATDNTAASLLSSNAYHMLEIRPDGHWEPCNQVELLSSTECTVRFEPRTFPFWIQRLNRLHYLVPKYLPNTPVNLTNANNAWNLHIPFTAFGEPVCTFTFGDTLATKERQGYKYIFW